MSNKGDGLAELDVTELFRLGSEALEMKDYTTARRYLSAAVARERTPNHLSQYALALAAHTKEIDQSIALCQEAVKHDPKNPEHFLRLGVIYLVASRKKEAIRIFRLGLRVGKHPTISRWLQVLGDRKKPVLPFLARSNPINKYLGKLRMSLTGR
ncbi:tetratricopeptide repeat protein [Geomonas limicola]|nr:tetratricopeptide repeat protein [Geomonas limicola]